MYEIMNHDKYEPARKRGGNKEQARIQEVMEEVDELQGVEEDTATEESQGRHKDITYDLV